MKQKGYILYLLCGMLSVCCLAGCDKSDDIDDDWRFEYPAPTFDDTELGQLRKELYDTYHVNFTPDYEEVFFEFDWNKTFDSFEVVRVAESEHAHTVEFLKEVKGVLEKMPGFLLERLPSNILLVDSLKNQYDISAGSEVVDCPVRGVMAYNVTNFIVLGFAGKSFPLQEKIKLYETWTNIFFERALEDYEAPEEFKQIVAAQKSGNTAGYELTASWRSNRTMMTYGFLEDSYVRCKQIVIGTANASTGELTQLNYSASMTEAQDLSLFIAFAMYRPEEEKEVVYGQSEVFAQKEEIVKGFCADTLGFELESLIGNE